MKNKIILIIALVCMLVPFMVLGSTASALTNSVESSDVTYIVNSGIFNSSTWVGSPQFLLTQGNAVVDTSIFEFGTWDAEKRVSFTVRNTNENVVVASSLTLTSGMQFTANTQLTFSVNDSVQHVVVMLFNFLGTNPQTIDDSFTINGLSPVGLPGSYASAITPRNVAYIGYGFDFSFNYLNWAFYGSTPTTQNGSDYFMTANDLHYLAFTASQGDYTIALKNSATATLNTPYLVGIFDCYTYEDGYSVGYSAGYQAGLQAGLEQGNNEVTVGNASYNAGVQAGIQQADNRVNKNSSSYQQGLTDGRADGQEYTFLGLIGAVIDAPINALFGHTTADGVFHPGLFSIEILGMDMSAFILSIFTLGLIIAILRLCLGGK